MAAKKWHCKTIKEDVHGVIPGISRNVMERELLEFLDAECLTPHDVNIETHTEVDELNAQRILVTQVFYFK